MDSTFLFDDIEEEEVVTEPKVPDPQSSTSLFNDLDDESTWRRWIERKRDAMRSVRNKLAGRIGADAQQGPASPAQSGSTIPSVGQSTSIGGVTVKRIS